MDKRGVQRRCPSCSGTKLRLGATTAEADKLRFKPEENWVTTHELIALACTDCGHVALFLPDSELHALRGEDE